VLMGEKGEGQPWFHWLGLLKCSKPMHALFKHVLLHVQVLVHHIVVSMEVEKDLKPFSKISEKLQLKF
jgi:hypothetical protein